MTAQAGTPGLAEQVLAPWVDLFGPEAVALALRMTANASHDKAMAEVHKKR